MPPKLLESSASHTASVLAAGEILGTETLTAPKLVSRAQAMWGISLCPEFTQGTRWVGATKSNLHPRTRELVAATTTPAIKYHKTSGPEMTRRETIQRESHGKGKTNFSVVPTAAKLVELLL